MEKLNDHIVLIDPSINYTVLAGNLIIGLPGQVHFLIDYKLQLYFEYPNSQGFLNIFFHNSPAFKIAGEDLPDL